MQKADVLFRATDPVIGINLPFGSAATGLNLRQRLLTANNLSKSAGNSRKSTVPVCLCGSVEIDSGLPGTKNYQEESDAP